VDGSIWGAAALRWAADHAARCGAPLQVWAPPGTVDRVPGDVDTPVVELHVSGTDPVCDLTAAARRARPVVIGHRGRSARRFGLGRSVLPLAAALTGTLVVVRGTAAALRGEHRRVTVMLSGGPDDDVILSVAAQTARWRDARLLVVHALPLPDGHDASAEDHLFVLDHASDRLAALRRAPLWSACLLRLHPHEVVTRSASSDLIVLGAGDHQRSRDRCGSVTRAVLHHAACPVMVVRRPGRAT
jgi:nucleotide-binding universal stress UspA family protein